MYIFAKLLYGYTDERVSQFQKSLIPKQCHFWLWAGKLMGQVFLNKKYLDASS